MGPILSRVSDFAAYKKYNQRARFGSILHKNAKQCELKRRIIVRYTIVAPSDHF